ncbi:hypothetical protein Ddye_020536 [Dipteronia dyeriana]|uniref:Myb/SANT-like domain-containing protein n=1 Tax=Dipteronia dyeriana TaxID=168575 RepID=A0AAD9TZX8_9ROSI|nr:hypothetical protein Ddye_020536 [Dipteronia dyeriana]
MKRLKDKYSTAYDMLNMSGFGWDDTHKYITVDGPEILEAYLKAFSVVLSRLGLWARFLSNDSKHDDWPLLHPSITFSPFTWLGLLYFGSTLDSLPVGHDGLAKGSLSLGDLDRGSDRTGPDRTRPIVAHALEGLDRSNWAPGLIW